MRCADLKIKKKCTNYSQSDKWYAHIAHQHPPHQRILKGQKRPRRNNKQQTTTGGGRQPSWSMQWWWPRRKKNPAKKKKKKKWKQTIFFAFALASISQFFFPLLVFLLLSSFKKKKLSFFLSFLISFFLSFVSQLEWWWWWNSQLTLSLEWMIWWSSSPPSSRKLHCWQHGMALVCWCVWWEVVLCSCLFPSSFCFVSCFVLFCRRLEQVEMTLEEQLSSFRDCVDGRIGGGVECSEWLRQLRRGELVGWVVDHIKSNQQKKAKLVLSFHMSVCFCVLLINTALSSPPQIGKTRTNKPTTTKSKTTQSNKRKNKRGGGKMRKKKKRDEKKFPFFPLAFFFLPSLFACCFCFCFVLFSFLFFIFLVNLPGHSWTQGTQRERETHMWCARLEEMHKKRGRGLFARNWWHQHKISFPLCVCFFFISLFFLFLFFLFFLVSSLSLCLCVCCLSLSVSLCLLSVPVSLSLCLFSFLTVNDTDLKHTTYNNTHHHTKWAPRRRKDEDQ